MCYGPLVVYLHADYVNCSSLGISHPTTLVLVPYAYPAYERQQRNPVYTSNSFAFVVFINEMPFIKRCGYGTERLRCARRNTEKESLKELTLTLTLNLTPNLTLTPMSQTYYLTEIQLRPIGTVRFLINNRRHIDAGLRTLLQHRRAQRRSIYLGHTSVV